MMPSFCIALLRFWWHLHQRPDEVEEIARCSGELPVIDNQDTLAAFEDLGDLVRVDHLKVVMEVPARDLPVLAARPDRFGFAFLDQRTVAETGLAAADLGFVLALDRHLIRRADPP